MNRGGGVYEREGGRTSDRAGRTGGARTGGGEHAHPPPVRARAHWEGGGGHAQTCPRLFCPSLPLLPPSPTCAQERHTTRGSAGVDDNGRGRTNRRGGTHAPLQFVHPFSALPPLPPSFPHLCAGATHNEGLHGVGQQREGAHEWEGGTRTPLLFVRSFSPLPPHLCAGVTHDEGQCRGGNGGGHTPRMGGRTRSNGSTRVRMPLFVPSSPPSPLPHTGGRTTGRGPVPRRREREPPAACHHPPSSACVQGRSTKGSARMGSRGPPSPLLAAPGPPPSFCPRPQPPRAVRAPRADPQAPTTCACVHTAPQDPCTPARRPAGTPFY